MRGEGIKKISALFEVYAKRLHAPQKTVVKGFCEAAEDVMGLSVPEHSVAYTPASRTLTLTVPGAVKSEILLKRTEILSRMREKLGEKNIPHDIV